MNFALALPVDEAPTGSHYQLDGGRTQIVWTQSSDSETPGPIDVGRFMLLLDATGKWSIEDSPSHVVREAYSYMESIAKSLPCSLSADVLSAKLLERAKKGMRVVPITRKARI